MTRATLRLGIAAALAVTALFSPAAQAADGTWERLWGKDVIQSGKPGDLGNAFEVCTVRLDCKFGTGGTLGGEFNAALGVALDASGNVYVADSSNGRIQKFDANGNWQRAWGQDVIQSLAPGDTGTGFEICTVAANCKQGLFGGGLGGELSLPQDVAVDAAGNVYVAEGQRIQKFDSNGNWQRAWGRDVVQEDQPGDVDPDGFEICTDAADCKVGDLNGALGGEFRGPNGIAVDSSGDVYVGDEIRQRIQKFDSNGNWERAWGRDVVQEDQTGDVDPDGFEVCTVRTTCKTGLEAGLGGEFNNPRRLAVDGAGDVYVGDIENQRIQKFDSDGAWERAWGKDVVTGGGTGFEVCTVAVNCKPGGTGGLGGEFINPIGVADDGAGNVYVADRDNMRIQRFDSNGTWERAWGHNIVTGGGAVYEVCIVAADCQSGQIGGGLGGELHQPDGIAASASGTVYATNPGPQWVTKFVDGNPAAPTITDTDPNSPADDNDPEVKGTVGPEHLTTVRIYKDDPTCGDPPDATGTPAEFTGAGITVNVSDDSTTVLRARVVDVAHNVSLCSAPFNYVEQTTTPPPNTPPNTTITSGPGTTTDHTPTFTFTSNEAGSTFQCSLNDGSFTACSSPFTTPSLPDGTHKLEVRAFDGIDFDPTPATRTFTITAPASAPPPPPPAEPPLIVGGCLNAQGGVAGKTLGPARLGRKRAAQRRIFKGAGLRSRKGLDRYCATGGGSFRIGYPTRRLLRAVSRRLRRKIKGRVALILTSSKRFSVKGVKVGDSARSARRKLGRPRRVKVGRNTWYLGSARSARLLVVVRGGRVRAVGIGDKRLQRGRRLTRAFLRAWEIGS